MFCDSLVVNSITVNCIYYFFVRFIVGKKWSKVNNIVIGIEDLLILFTLFRQPSYKTDVVC